MEKLPQYEALLPLAEFIKQWPEIDCTNNNQEIYLYHGTNCFRRWEINKAGAILPGRNSYSFFCSHPDDAYSYARAACLRDLGQGSINSLISEPVVLKVKFNSRIWLQVDFATALPLVQPRQTQGLSIAVLGPISSALVEDVLNCGHGCRGKQTVRTFDDGRFLQGIQRLREKASHPRLDAWLLRKLEGWTRAFAEWFHGGPLGEPIYSQQLRRLSHACVRYN